MSIRYVIFFMKSTPKRSDSQLAERVNSTPFLSALWIARISKHFDKPGFDELIKLGNLAFCSLDLKLDSVKTTGDFVLIIF